MYCNAHTPALSKAKTTAASSARYVMQQVTKSSVQYKTDQRDTCGSETNIKE
jgi:hypothetical protein